MRERKRERERRGTRAKSERERRICRRAETDADGYIPNTKRSG